MSDACARRVQRQLAVNSRQPKTAGFLGFSGPTAEQRECPHRTCWRAGRLRTLGTQWAPNWMRSAGRRESQRTEHSRKCLILGVSEFVPLGMRGGFEISRGGPEGGERIWRGFLSGVQSELANSRLLRFWDHSEFISEPSARALAHSTNCSMTALSG
jgi:hypothetical protein